MIRRPPISTRTDTLFPYTTLFRSDVILGQTIPAFDAGLCNDMNSVVSAAHHVAGHIIGNDPVAALSGKLGLGMVQDLLGFSRKTDEQARALRIASQTGQYVRRSEEQTSELQSLMRTPYAVSSLKKQK